MTEAADRERALHARQLEEATARQGAEHSRHLAESLAREREEHAREIMTSQLFFPQEIKVNLSVETNPITITKIYSDH